MGLLIGVTVSTVAIGATLNLMNKGLERYLPTEIPVNIQSLPSGVKIERDSFTYQGKNYALINSLGSHEVPTANISMTPSRTKSNTSGRKASAATKLPLRKPA